MTRPPRERDMSAKVERLLARCAPTRLAADAVEELARRWRQSFAANVKSATGNPTFNGFDWHAFSEGFARAVDGDAARNEYRRRQDEKEIIVLVGSVPRQGFRCSGDMLPIFDGKALDVHVVASDFSWTMVFTHESYLGPYFTTSAWASGAPPAPGTRDDG
jgi:hypothetical protein